MNVTGASLLSINGVTLNGNASTGIELDPGAGSMSIGAPVLLGGSQQWFNNSGSALTVTGALSLGANTLTFSGSGQTSVSAPVTGQGNLVVTPGANVVLSTASSSTTNSYLGTTQINGGLLTLQGPAGSVLLPQTTYVALSNGGTLISTASAPPSPCWPATPRRSSSWAPGL